VWYDLRLASKEKDIAKAIIGCHSCNYITDIRLHLADKPTHPGFEEVNDHIVRKPLGQAVRQGTSGDL
jgi:hypothetical protein